MKRRPKIFDIILLLLLIFFLLLVIFKPLREAVVNAVPSLGVAADTVGDIAIGASGLLVGVLLIKYGVLALAVPFVGIALVVVGSIVAALGAWFIFRQTGTTKPDNTTINGKD